MNLAIKHSVLSGSVVLPPSKSHSIRSLLFAAMASGQSTIDNLLISPDIMAMEQAVVALGAKVIKGANGTTRVVGNAGKIIISNKNIFVGNSGQVLRFMAAMCALQHTTVELSGDESANARPMSDLLQAINQLGGKAKTVLGNNCAPIQVSGNLTKSIAVLNGQDSQFVSALLMAAPFRECDTEIVVNNPGELPWIDLTCSWLDKLNISYQRKGYQSYLIKGNNVVKGFSYTVPADFSSMAFPVAAAIITQSELLIANLDYASEQGDLKIIDVLEKMGANFIKGQDYLKVLPSKLHGGVFDINHIIDAMPILSVLATQAEGETILTNIGVARTKECDRLSCMTKELTKMGADIKEFDDYLVIKQANLHGAEVFSYHDHRVAMSLIVAGMVATGVTNVMEIDCINKSYPGFIQDLLKLGCNIKNA